LVAIGLIGFVLIGIVLVCVVVINDHGLWISPKVLLKATKGHYVFRFASTQRGAKIKNLLVFSKK